MKTIIIAGGGTGGHIFPGLALALSLRARGCRVLWLGADGMERSVAAEQGIEFQLLPIRKFRGQSWFARIRSVLTVFSALARARALLHKHRADAVVSLGGFAALPTALATALSPIQLYVLEQNAIAGWSSRIALPLARRAFVAYSSALPSSKTLVSGNPLRAEFTDTKEPTERYSKRRGALRVAVLGGSQGARALNQTVATCYAALPSATRAHIQIKHQCGRLHAETQQLYGDALGEVELVEFWQDPLPIYLWADLIICRAGAMTVSEVSAVGVAALFVPYPYAASDHQYHNTLELVERDAAWLCTERDFNLGWLTELLTKLQTSPITQQRRALAQLATRAHSHALRTATETISTAILEDLQAPSTDARSSSQ